MKKRILLIAMIAISSTAAIAQSAYNKWSIEGGVGLNRPYRNLTQGYYTNDFNFITGDLGVRFMWSEYFGAKIDFGYNAFTNADNSFKFDSDYSRADLQFVVNAGKVMNFQEWTKTIGLLLHTGGGVGFLGSDLYDGYDVNGHFLGGATVQFRLSNRVALNLDATAILPMGKLDYTFDGVSPDVAKGYIFNGTIGLSVYLGKNKKHSDWYSEKSDGLADLLDKYQTLEDKVNAIKTVKPEELAATNDNVKELAKKVDNFKGGSSATASNYDEFVANLSNDGFIAAYFDVNSTTVKSSSANNINFLRTYMANNPNATVEVRGYADETGSADYNQKLSQRRADAAAKMLVEAGIDSSRINAIGEGVDSSVSAKGRNFARRAIFVVKK